MVYGYIRVSGDRQDYENQRFELLKFANERGLRIEEWVSETVSTRKSLEQRKLSELLARLSAGDVLLLSELTRIGRSLFEVMGILNELMKRGVSVMTSKERYVMDGGINSKILAFAFGLAGEIERDLISMRTREALARKRAEGMRLGRPIGSRNKSTKLTGRESQIRELLSKQVSVSAIARILGVNRITLTNFIGSRELEPKH